VGRGRSIQVGADTFFPLAPSCVLRSSAYFQLLY
jgi:hypothetical protein